MGKFRFRGTLHPCKQLPAPVFFIDDDSRAEVSVVIPGQMPRKSREGA